MPETFLNPGEYFVGYGTRRVKTLLGSCVSVTLWHPALRFGAMCHFLLWQRPAKDRSSPEGRYGEEVLLLMAEELGRAGIAMADCVAKVFGGGNMFPGIAMRGFQVGQDNGDGACAWLRRHNIPIIAEHLFGFGYRQIVFDIGNGDVWVKRVETYRESSI